VGGKLSSNLLVVLRDVRVKGGVVAAPLTDEGKNPSPSTTTKQFPELLSKVIL
jgi:hypothetical protein